MDLKRKLTATACIVLLAGSANVSAAIWQGTANYDGGAIDSPNLFSGYGFNTGLVIGDLTSGTGGVAPSEGATFTNYVALDVKDYLDTIGDSLGSFDTLSTGELTLVAKYDDVVSYLTGSLTFTVTSGTWGLFYDATPDLLKPADGLWSGFGDGTMIMGGTIDAGGNTGSSVELSGTITYYDTNVFIPEVNYTSAVFGYQLNELTLDGDYGNGIKGTNLTGFNSDVTASIVAGDTIARATVGSMMLYTPIPAAAWLFGSAMIGLMGYRNRKMLFGLPERVAAV